MYLALFCIPYLFFALGPPITTTTQIDGKTALPKENQTTSDISSGPFTMRTPTMTTYAQQLWVIAKLTTGNTDGKKCSRNGIWQWFFYKYLRNKLLVVHPHTRN